MQSVMPGSTRFSASVSGRPGLQFGSHQQIQFTPPSPSETATSTTAQALEQVARNLTTSFQQLNGANTFQNKAALVVAVQPEQQRLDVIYVDFLKNMFSGPARRICLEQEAVLGTPQLKTGDFNECVMPSEMKERVGQFLQAKNLTLSGESAQNNDGGVVNTQKPYLVQFIIGEPAPVYQALDIQG